MAAVELGHFHSLSCSAFLMMACNCSGSWRSYDTVSLESCRRLTTSAQGTEVCKVTAEAACVNPARVVKVKSISASLYTYILKRPAISHMRSLFTEVLTTLMFLALRSQALSHARLPPQKKKRKRNCKKCHATV